MREFGTLRGFRLATSRKRWLMPALKVLVTLGMVGWVLSMIEWQDKLRLPDGKLAKGRFVAAPAEPGLRGYLDDGAARHPVPLASANKSDIDPFQPGFVRVVTGVSRKRLGLAAILLPFTALILALRWRWLLQTHGVDPGYRETLRLTWIGMFANNVLPSSVGGDGIKMWCIARRAPGQGVDAAMTVLVDRVLGLVSLLCVGCLAVALGDLPKPANASAAFDKLQLLPWALSGALAAIVGGAFLFFSGRFRAKLGLPHALGRLPFGHRLMQLDGALFHFRSHPGTMGRAIAVSLLLHLLSITLVALIGGALGMQASLSQYFMFVPLIFVGTAFLPSIGGLGVQEGAFVFFFTLPFVGDSASQAVALSLVYRMMMILLALPGAFWGFGELSRRRQAPPAAGGPLPAAAPAG